MLSKQCQVVQRSELNLCTQVKKEMASIKKKLKEADKGDAKKFGGMFDKMAAKDAKYDTPAPAPAPAPVPTPAPPPEPLDLSAEDAGEDDDNQTPPTMADATAAYDSGNSVGPAATT
eukprot:SAG31_NODE_2575_length_5453_cov_7.045013_6_plen_117_part_00